ncbi:MAG: type II toxin-antitoxin system RelE/ParE family toxin [Bacteroidota bacterium]|nr:type II toxin-antitoxin system RelE/ParE family toxin [Bacteroidota bacterium]
MAYQVNLKKQATKVLETINEPYYAKLKKAIYGLADNPRPQGYIKLRSRNGYRIRVADYRILYEIFDDTLSVDIINLGHRKDIYE